MCKIATPSQSFPRLIFFSLPLSLSLFLFREMESNGDWPIRRWEVRGGSPATRREPFLSPPFFSFLLPSSRPAVESFDPETGCQEDKIVRTRGTSPKRLFLSFFPPKHTKTNPGCQHCGHNFSSLSPPPPPPFFSFLSRTPRIPSVPTKKSAH